MSQPQFPKDRQQRMIKRLPFTLVTLVLLIMMAIGTNSAVERLTQSWIRRIGYAPRDLLRGEIGRLFTSALVTHGRWTFVGALLAVAVMVGSAELRTSTRRTTLTFWGVHLLTLLALTTPLFEKPMARDVGPSAGYFACLGLAITTLSKRPRWLAFVVVLALLTIALFQPPRDGLSAAVKFSADAAHLIAFPLGFLVNSGVKRNA